MKLKKKVFNNQKYKSLWIERRLNKQIFDSSGVCDIILVKRPFMRF